MPLSSLRRTTLTLITFTAFALGGVSAHADVNARIKGVIVDPTNAVVSGATVTATNLATGVKFNEPEGRQLPLPGAPHRHLLHLGLGSWFQDLHRLRYRPDHRPGIR